MGASYIQHSDPLFSFSQKDFGEIDEWGGGGVVCWFGMGLILWSGNGELELDMG